MTGTAERIPGATGIALAPESFLVHRGMRYLKVSVFLVVASLIPYFVYDPPAGHNGGTWLGYTLGTIGALLIVWLMWFGIRKRGYGPGNFNLKGWLSAHVYLGLSLIIIASLHANFQVGWNIHTLAYVLMLLVIISGIFGVVVYARLPRLMTLNRRSQTTNLMAREILDLDRQCADLALELGDDFVAEVNRSRNETVIGGDAWRQLSGRDPKCGTTKAVQRVQDLARTAPPDMRGRAGGLLAALSRKQDLVQRLRRDIRLKALMDFWLVFHVPMSFGLLAALTAHIISIFFYWG